MKNRSLASAPLRATPLCAARYSLQALLLTGAVLLIPDYSFAQNATEPTSMQCQLIKLAVAQYGYAAARRHALETYGPEAVKVGDKCFTEQQKPRQ